MKKNFLQILGYVFGFICAFMTIGSFVSYGFSVPAISIFFATLLLIPYTSNFINQKLPFNLLGIKKALIIIVLICSFSVTTSKKEEIVNLEEFKENRTTIITDLESLLEKGDYYDAVKISKKYLASNDNDLQKIQNKVNKLVVEKKKEELIKTLLSQLKSTPSNDYDEKLSIYRKLYGSIPSNKEYYEKIVYYVKKVKERDAALEKQKKIESQFSVWDGSHVNLESHIKKYMNDPSSYKHVETRYSDKGSHLLVGTSFRGKNAFGALILNTIMAKVDLNGNIIEIVE